MAASNTFIHAGLVVPAVGQAQGEMAVAVASGDVGRVATDGGGTGFGAGEAGQGGGGAQRVYR